jgi:hypothetical protein
MAFSKIAAENLGGSTLPALAGGSLTGITTGKVLQVVQSTAHLTYNTTSTSFVDIDSTMSASITPSSSSNKVLISFNTYLSNTHGNTFWLKLLRDSTEIGSDHAGNGIDASGDQASNWNRQKGNMTFLDSPSTTSATTYKLQWKVDGNTLYLNRVGAATSRGGRSHITLMEIQA